MSGLALCTPVQPARPAQLLSASRRQARRARGGAAARVTRAAVKVDSTTSGLEIKGMRPTSPKAWEEIATTIKKAGVTFISLQQAEAAARKGTPVVDVRPANEFKGGRIPGATNCQFYQPIQGWDPARVARRVGFALFGVPATEANPAFLDQVAAAVPNKGKGMILVCNIGGSLEPTGPSKFGRQSRSLTAAYELVQAGYRGIKVLEGGQTAWNKAEMEVEVDA